MQGIDIFVRRRLAPWALALGCAVAAVLPLGVHAQAYPAKPVRFIVPFPPGGAIDTLARIVAHRLGASWNETVTVENRPGAGGSIGTDMVAKSAPDGYTFGWGAVSTHGINAALYQNLPYDTLADFEPVTPVATVPNVLIVNSSLAVNSVDELVKLARTKPLLYASAGNGSTLHISCELFKHLAQVDLLHVPYKGSGPAMSDVIGGQVPVMCDSVTSALPHIRSGKVRALGVTTTKRSPLLPTTPTLAEVGIKDYEMNVWYGIFAPANTPAEIVARLNADVAKIVALPEVRERLKGIGAEPLIATPEQFRQSVRSDMTKWAKLVKQMSITLD